jgi:hypothetical protein
MVFRLLFELILDKYYRLTRSRFLYQFSLKNIILKFTQFYLFSFTDLLKVFQFYLES